MWFYRQYMLPRRKHRMCWLKMLKNYHCTVSSKKAVSTLLIIVLAPNTILALEQMSKWMSVINTLVLPKFWQRWLKSMHRSSHSSSDSIIVQVCPFFQNHSISNPDAYRLSLGFWDLLQLWPALDLCVFRVSYGLLCIFLIIFYPTPNFPKFLIV